jgi:hypothetical protein
VLFRPWLRALCLSPFLLLILTAPTASAAGGPFATAMQAASQSRGVPLAVVEATAYVDTRWEWIDTPSHNGGVGPMNVTPAQLPLATSLSGHSSAEIDGDLAANLDAGAALIAHYHSAGTDLASWEPAVAATQGSLVADEIFSVLRSGATRTTSTGETITLAPQSVTSTSATGGAASIDTGATTTACTTAPDYPSACWIPADPSNYSVADRPHDYPIDMIVIHDIEGSAASGIQDFETPNWAASAHYVVDYDGSVTQMVREKDIAWHAGNWDYNTRSIGIEHAGFAWTPGLYTTAEYNGSAAIAASICSRYGVPMDRTHVIGHDEVPDPNNPGLFGGSDHHTDPGPYWDWTYYMATAQADTKALPSPPHIMPDPVATNGLTSATVTWTAARTCRAADAPITGYTITGQPGNLSATVSASTTSYTFQNLTPQTTYTFTVTAHNSYGDGTATSNPTTPGRCATVGVSANPASPQMAGTAVQVTATSTGCANPTYEFWYLPPGSSTYQLGQAYSSNSVFNWNTTGKAAGVYYFSIWAMDAASTGNDGDSLGRWDAYNPSLQYAINPARCLSVTATASPPSGATVGTAVTLSAAVSCPSPRFQFEMLAPGSQTWQVVQPYSTAAVFNWSTGGAAAGTYRFIVKARDASSAGLAGSSTGSWDSYTSLTYTLGSTPCASVTATPSGTNPVVITAVASGCPNPRYQFEMLAPGSQTWQVVQAYSTNSVFNWNTTGAPSGTYRFIVKARDASSAGTTGNYAGTWDAYVAISYALNTVTCTSVTASTSGTNPVAITATATGCPNPRYQFEMLAPNSATWQVVQAYSSNGSFTWNTTGLAKGTYKFIVKARDASSPGTTGTGNANGAWDAYTVVTYTLS